MKQVQKYPANILAFSSAAVEGVLRFIQHREEE
jgi:hypothetical protein